MTSIEMERMGALGPAAARAAANCRAKGDGEVTIMANAFYAELLEQGIQVELLDEPAAFRPRLLPPVEPNDPDALPCGA